jgi:hypothetical protein
VTIDYQKILKGALIAAGGAVIAYATTALTGIASDNPQLAMLITAIGGFAINTAKKLLEAWAAKA